MDNLCKGCDQRDEINKVLSNEVDRLTREFADYKLRFESPTANHPAYFQNFIQTLRKPRND